MTAAERRAETKRAAMAAGHSPAVATALARIPHERHRKAIARGLAGTGIADGPPRAYLVALAGYELAGGDYPSCPAKVRPADAAIVQARAVALAEAILPAADRPRR